MGENIPKFALPNSSVLESPFYESSHLSFSLQGLEFQSLLLKSSDSQSLHSFRIFDFENFQTSGVFKFFNIQFQILRRLQVSILINLVVYNVYNYNYKVYNFYIWSLSYFGVFVALHF